MVYFILNIVRSSNLLSIIGNVITNKDDHFFFLRPWILINMQPKLNKDSLKIYDEAFFMEKAVNR